jgi:hypothetical protein
MIKTSYFAKSGKDPNAVCIAAFAPSWFSGTHYPRLSPPWKIVVKYKQGQINEDEYEELYNHLVLSSLNVGRVARELDGAVLLCYEKPDDFCHRHIVARWLSSAIGYEIEEI